MCVGHAFARAAVGSLSSGAGGILIWGRTGRDFVDAYLQCVPEPLRSIAVPFAHVFDPPNMNPFYHSLLEAGEFKGGLLLPDFREHSSAGDWATAAGHQRGSHLNKDGWPRLVPCVKSEQQHWDLAHGLTEHPFASHPCLPSDLQFAISAVCQGAGVMTMRKAVQRRWLLKRRELQPLTLMALRAMSPRVRAVAFSYDVGLHLYLQILLAWPDVTYAARLVTGFQVIGAIESPPIYRSVTEWPLSQGREEFFEGAAEYMDDLVGSMGPSDDPLHDVKCLELSLKDVAQGTALGPVTEQQLRMKYRSGSVRAMPRFAVLKGNLQYRAIDNGKRSGHNAHSQATVRVHTSTHELFLLACRAFFREGETLKETWGVCSLEFGVDDESSAYRWKPTADADQAALICCFWHPEWQEPAFLELLGHPFGLSAAVLNYNRGPELADIQ